MARCGWDSLVVDMQHGLVDYTDAVPMLSGDLADRRDPDGARAVEHARTSS